MRHGDKINNLGRKKAHREALVKQPGLPADPAQKYCNYIG